MSSVRQSPASKLCVFLSVPVLLLNGNSIMLEVEAKFRLMDPKPVEARLRTWGAKLVADHVEADHYLNAPDRDFARTDEAFRLRRIGERNLLTYKGPRHDAISKTPRRWKSNARQETLPPNRS